MKHTTFIILLLVFCITLTANDGSFYASGNNLIPLQETRISLTKEVLKFHVKQFNMLYVDVYFEFYNPDEEKKLIVGFVTPPASGDVSENEENHPNINDFSVMVNDTKLPFKVKRMKETSFKSDLNSNTNDFVYYFEVTFKKGLNIIKHTYKYKANSSVEAYRGFDYQITTGKRWANKKINDFELRIHLDNGIFYIPASLTKGNKNINWKIKGSGVFKEGTEMPFFDQGTIPYKYVHLNSGYIYFNETNFTPDFDIHFGENAWHSYTHKWCNKVDSCSKNDMLRKIAPYCNLKPEYNEDPNSRIDLTRIEIKVLKNYFYAVRGLKFKTQDIAKFYSTFFWYKPILELKADAIKLSAEEQKFVAYLSIMEKEIQLKED